MDNAGKELLDTDYPHQPQELLQFIGKLLARLDALRHEKMRYFHGFKHTKEDFSTFEEFELKIVEGLIKLYSISHHKDFFWYDCSLKVYKNTFTNRLQELKQDYPELTENELLRRDYQALDILPLYGQRFLRTHLNEIQYRIDYGHILDKRRKEDVNPVLLEKADEVKEILERTRDEKMRYIQAQFHHQGKHINKTGDTFEITDLPTVKVIEKHNEIFAKNGFELFEYLLKEYVPPARGRLNAISYFFHRMKKDDYIHSTENRFLNWYSEIYQFELASRLKTIHVSETKGRKRDYEDAIRHHEQLK